MTHASSPAEPAVDPALLQCLLASTRARPLAELAEQLGQSADTIAYRLDELRRAGCTIDDHPQRGISLREAGLGTWLDYLQHRFGKSRPMQVYQRTASTQDVARRLFQTRPGSAHGAVVVADEQTAGRGRFGRAWTAPAGRAVMFSLVHRLDATGETAPIERFTLATSVALAKALEPWLARGDARLAIRWPNDLYLGGAKLAGILVESVHANDAQAAIIGVGLNVVLSEDQINEARAALGKPITSLHQAGAPAPRLAVLDAAIKSLDTQLHTADTTALLDGWRSRCDLLDRRVMLSHAGGTVAGHVVDLDPHAGLILRTDAGTLTHLPAANTSLLHVD
jgi:BirA family biotin operon repressor/biotin-[acetyl-CoA-carboxylase] ligase